VANDTHASLLREWLESGRFLVANCDEKEDLVARTRAALENPFPFDVNEYACFVEYVLRESNEISRFKNIRYATGPIPGLALIGASIVLLMFSNDEESEAQVEHIMRGWMVGEPVTQKGKTDD